MDLIRKQVPVLSLVACTALLWCAWWMTATRAGGNARVQGVPLEVRSPGVAAGKPQWIRVGVRPEAQRSVSLEISGPFRIRPVGSDRVLHDASRLARTTVTATEHGLKIGKQEFPVTRIEIVPTKSPAVWVEDHQYRGRMRLFRQQGGKVLVVNVLLLEDYIASVVDSEMPAAFP